MKLPKEKIGGWAAEIIDECMVSQKQRITDGSTFKEYYFSGNSGGSTAPYNACYPHIDTLTSYLFSPGDVHFQCSFSQPDKVNLAMGETAARHLSYEFHRTGVDLAFASAVESSLIKGCAYTKTIWGHDGFQTSVVQPEVMGMLREDINGLDRQEAFCHQIFLTEGQFHRLIDGHPEEKELLKQASSMQSARASDEFDDSYFHQIVIGGTNPVQQQGASPQYGMSQVFGSPVPSLAPQVKDKLIVLNELWVWDDDREDWTTIQMVKPDIVIEGKLRHRNLTGIKGEIPFEQVCANHVEGYAWGRSELAVLKPLQDMLNRRMGEIDRISRLRAKPPRMLTGSSGITDEQRKAANSPGGYFVDNNPNAKIQSLAPEMPPEIFQQVNEIKGFFDDVGGFQSITKGQGEQGVRSGVHAETLLRTASPRLRDRALLIERQCSAVGDFCMKLLQAKIADKFKTSDGETEFLLDQLPDDMKVQVNSHSSSPAFSQEAQQQAAMLLKAGAIDPIEFIKLTHPAMEDIILQKAEERAKQKSEEQAEIMQEAKKNPSIMAKLVGKKK